jgi:transposase
MLWTALQLCWSMSSKVRRSAMDQVVTVGLDIAKSVFQVHGVDAAGEVVVRRQIRRAQLLSFFSKLPPCLIGIEACASAHHWARELGALGHQVRLMPASYVKPNRTGSGRKTTRPTRRRSAKPSNALQCASSM